MSREMAIERALLVLRSPSVRRNSLTTRCGPHRIVRFLRSLERHKSKTMEGQEGRNPGTQERKDGMPESQLLKEPTNDGVGRGTGRGAQEPRPRFRFLGAISTLAVRSRNPCIVSELID